MEDKDKIDVLLAEHRVLYRLIYFRMTSLERRVPIAGTMLAAFLGSIHVLPTNTQVILLLGFPVVLLVFLRTTINHARSFEDVLRRLDEIEQHVNRIAEEDLLIFQSRHPSKKHTVGGRTGAESVLAIFLIALVILAACGYLFLMIGLDWTYEFSFLSYLVSTFFYLLSRYVSYRRYEYKHSEAPNSRIITDKTC